MARHGITYADVAKVAAEITDEGKSVTVDSVRAALGSTGSKSTIAPMVKRWKVEHEAKGRAAATGLPAHLLEAVTALNERMQADADVRIQALTEVHEKALAELTDRLGEVDARGVLLIQERDSLAGQLAVQRTRHEGLLQQHHALQFDATKAHSDIEGLKHRLADRGTEIDGLQAQIARGREQFEHYQQSVAAQRAEERQQSAQQVARLEQDLAETRRHLAAAQTHATQIETRLELSTQRVQQQDAELATLRSARHDLAYECQTLSYQVSTLGERNTAIETQLQHATASQAASQADLAVAQHARAAVVDRLRDLEKRFAEMDGENRSLLQRNALLQGRLDAPSMPSG